MGKIFYVMGKSASGKDTLCAALRARFGDHLRNVIGYTTRPIRSGEVEGDPYHFISGEELAAFRNAGKVIEERTYQTIHGPWTYATIDDGSVRPASRVGYLTVGTPESYRGLRDYFGAEALVPLYVRVEDGLRLERALARERTQEEPKYAELCRRYLADEADFAPEKLAELGLNRVFENESFETCLAELSAAIEAELEKDAAEAAPAEASVRGKDGCA